MNAIEPDDRSRRCFLKASSMLGLAVAFKSATIGEAFAESRIAGKANTMTRSSATQRGSEQATDKTTIRPFQVIVPEPELTELRRRINSTRWPDRETVTDESQGLPLATIQELARYWATDYDWRKIEAKLNALPQFITEIDGLDIHFIHVRSKYENALPLIVTHGWPGSVIEQLKIIDPLTDPTAYGGSASDAFHLVIPSMPGYGFSARPTTSGWGPERTASAWVVLMKRLGYAKYVAQGGDLGAGICTVMAKHAPPELLGIHTNFPGTIPSDIEGTPVRRPTAIQSVTRRKTRIRAAHGLIREATCLRTNDGNSPANALWIGGFARLPGSLAL